MDTRNDNVEIECALGPDAKSREIEAEWLALQARARPCFFTSWTWIGAWLELIEDAEKPALLRARHDGRVIGLALLVARTRWRRGILRSRAVHLTATGDANLDCIAIEHNGWLAEAGCEEILASALIRWFGSTRSTFDELYLNGMTARVPDRALAVAGLHADTTEVPWFLVRMERLAASGGDPAVLLTRNARQQMRRTIRFCETLGPISAVAAESTSEALAFFDDMKRLHVASWQRRGKAHAFERPFFEQFHRRLIARAFPEGLTQLLRVSAGAHLLGYLYNFVHDGCVYAYQSGFNDEDPRLRPGYISHYMAIRDAYLRGARTYDFLAGANRLKETFATDRTVMYWQRIQHPRLRFQLERAGRRLKRAIGS